MEHDDLLAHVLDVLEDLGVDYMIVGSLASGAYGEPRMTQDVDVVVNLAYGQVAPLCDRFPQPDYYVSPDAARQAIRTGGQFNIIHVPTADKVDMIALRFGTWHEGAFGRRRKLQMLPGREVYTAAPEDIILSKMEFYREGGSEKHLRDITGILQVSGELVDRRYVQQWSQKLGLTDIWRAVLRRLGESEG